MHTVNQLIDFSVWTGHWPFIHLRYGKLDVLKKKLQALNVEKAFLAPIEGILEQDPMRADKALLHHLDDNFFSPVPIIDLSYENWQECMDISVTDGRVRMIKLIPNYHMYKLHESSLGQLVELTSRYNMIISIQMRIEDRRGQYPLMQVDDVEYHDVLKALYQYPEQVFILNNAMMHDTQMLELLDNVYFDISSLEYQDTLEVLYNKHSLDRFVFSSHCPFFFPEGNVNKLRYSGLEREEIEKVAFKNAEKIFIKKDNAG